MKVKPIIFHHKAVMNIEGFEHMIKGFYFFNIEDEKHYLITHDTELRKNIYREIKPETLMLNNDTEVPKLPDFLIEFLLFLNEKGLINNHDFDYEKESLKYLNKKQL